MYLLKSILEATKHVSLTTDQNHFQVMTTIQLFHQI